MRERVALIDQTSFSKFEIAGRGRARRAAAPRGRRHGQAGRQRHLHAAAATSAAASSPTSRSRGWPRTASISSPAAPSATHDLHWIRSASAARRQVVIRDVTSARAVINLCGPLAREVLQRVAEEDVSNAAFPFATAQQHHASARRRCWRSASAMSASSAGSCISRPNMPRMSTRRSAGRRRGIRHRQCRLSRDRHAADGEGLSLLEQPTSRPTTTRYEAGPRISASP